MYVCLWSGNSKEAKVARTEVSSEKYQGPECYLVILRTWLLLQVRWEAIRTIAI